MPVSQRRVFFVVQKWVSEVQFKIPSYMKQYDELPLILKFIVKDADEIARAFGKEMVITRVSDKVDGESGVHPDKRAVDCRDQFKGEFLFTEDERKAIVHFINAKYSRKDKHSVCLWHHFNDGAYHFHFQVPYETRMI